ncbi:MAG: biotin/lipoyl-binding protein, partial [Planctomycetota bacterium]
MRAAAPIVLALAAACGGAAEGKRAGGGTYDVRRGALKIVLTENGSFKTKNSSPVRAETSAKIEWLVDEGKAVKKDDVLVELDKKDVKREVEQFQNQVTQLESELKSAKTEELIQEDQNKTDVEKAELQLKVAKATLEKLLEGDIRQEERKLELRIDKAQTDLRRAEERVKGMEQLLKEEFITPEEFEQEVLARKTAQTELESALLEKELYLRFQKPLDIEQKQASVVEAERGLVRARTRAEAQLDAKRAQVRQ